MLDETIVYVLRRRNMTDERKRAAPKWQRAVRTAEWLSAQLPLDANVQIQMPATLAGVKLLFIAQPNAPSGVWLQTEGLQRVIQQCPGVVVIDEAYVDFAKENCLALASRNPNVLVARTFSKSAALAGMRLGWVTGHGTLIAALDKVKDSYNVNRLSQLAGEAAIEAAFL